MFEVDRAFHLAGNRWKYIFSRLLDVNWLEMSIQIMSSALNNSMSLLNGCIPSVAIHCKF